MFPNFFAGVINAPPVPSSAGLAKRETKHRRAVPDTFAAKASPTLEFVDETRRKSHYLASVTASPMRTCELFTGIRFIPNITPFGVLRKVASVCSGSGPRTLPSA